MSLSSYWLLPPRWSSCPKEDIASILNQAFANTDDTPDQTTANNPQPDSTSSEGRVIALAVGLVVLVVIYLLIQFAAVRIPLRPFFTITSLLMAFMAFTFTGSGIGELQEADVVSLTPISGFPTIDLLGIYPRVENLAAQAIVLAIIVGLYFFGKARLAREAAAQSRAED